MGGSFGPGTNSMNGDRVFLDTNILVYAHDLDAGHKQTIALRVIRELWEARSGVLSVQVLQEFYVTMTRGLKRPLTPTAVREIIRDYGNWPVQMNDADSVLAASRIEEKYRLSFWDSLIIAAAVRAKAAKILTEDLQSGQVIEGILIENPFLAAV